MFHSDTTNLHDHLVNRHSGTYKGDDGKNEKQGMLLQSLARPKHCSEARAKEITNSIAKFVAQDMRPMRDVEGQEFIKVDSTSGARIQSAKPKAHCLHQTSEA